MITGAAKVEAGQYKCSRTKASFFTFQQTKKFIWLAFFQFFCYNDPLIDFFELFLRLQTGESII